MFLHCLLVTLLVFGLQAQPLFTADSLHAMKTDMLRNINSQVNLQIANDAVNKPQSFNVVKQYLSNEPLIVKSVPISLPPSVTSAISSARSFMPDQLVIQKANPIDIRKAALVSNAQPILRIQQPVQSIQLIQPVQQMQVNQPLQTIQQIQPVQSIQPLASKISLSTFPDYQSPSLTNLKQTLFQKQIKYPSFQSAPLSLSRSLNNNFNDQSLNTNRIVNEGPILRSQLINAPNNFANYAVQANPISNPVPISFQTQNKVVGSNNLISGLQNRIMASNCDVKGSGNFIYEI